MSYNSSFYDFNKTNKYNTVINPLGRLGIYRFIIYKKQLHCFTAERIIKLLIWKNDKIKNDKLNITGLN